MISPEQELIGGRGDAELAVDDELGQSCVHDFELSRVEMRRVPLSFHFA